MPDVGNIQSNHSLISISDTIYEQKEIEQYLAFAGIPPEKFIALNFPDDNVGVDKYDAKNLVNFIKAQGDQQDFIIHCYMGISRSGAIAKFINEYYDMGDHVLEYYDMYNRQVYNNLNAVIGKDIASYYAELEKQEISFDLGSDDHTTFKIL